jgi:transposase InsO family protein
MDFITGLPKAHGKDCIFVVVDRFTKFAHFFSISMDFSASQVADLFFKEVFRLHGLPKTIVSDRDNRFTSIFWQELFRLVGRASHVADLFFKEVFRLHGLPKTFVSDRDNRFMSIFWQELFRLVGIELTPSTSYHPQTNGQTEMVNKWVEGYLRNYVARQQKAWVKWLYLSEYCYNTTHHMSIGMSPFKALYSYDPLTFVEIVFEDSRAPMAKEWIQESQDILKELKDHLQRAQN